MNTIIIILSVIVGLLILFLILALFAKKEYNIHREITIHATRDQVFNYLKQLKNQDHFNKWIMVDPDMQKTFKGTDGTVGFIYAWNGKKAGEGEQEIMAIAEGKSIETEIRFVRPFVNTANADLHIESISETETKVIWRNASQMKYPFNVMVSMLEKMLAKDMDTSLSNLKNILEK
ncbi:MAG: SRPBCC family protein [Saprospiraceae bacterium]|nr:SRPBCC family protein [Saprospiraceae bacterium]MBK7810060.1 SRPBCC family protein [Saprospiraceae bacterium]MBK9629662.1 SRPBCC family protein [Saprospiraceae bacterium]